LREEPAQNRSSTVKEKLELIVAADNAKPKKITVNIELTGDWFETEQQMFSRGVKVSIS